MRVLVVPTGIIGFPICFIRFCISDLRTMMVSECMACSPMVSVATGRKVPAPTCSVTSSKAKPFSCKDAMSGLVKCNPAVGAATEPS